jgi:AbrB family looped-hinge helix DNA binding protein
MVTKVSTKGQVVLPSAIRRKLGIQAGDEFDVEACRDGVLLKPRKKQVKRKAKIIIDPVSGLPAVTLGPGAPVLTSKEVEEMLADFP